MHLPPTHPARRRLKEIFGFDGFRPHQENLVAASVEGRDIFASLPTGGGKSLCYQLPALLREGLTVVVSPLIALMKDQVDAARDQGIPAAALHGALKEDERRETYRNLGSGNLKLLYLAPERLAVEGTMDRLIDAGASAMAVDEAHCISEWGHDFRPDYRLLSRVREAWPNIPIWAYTATATKRVQEDVISHLGLNDPLVVRASFDRKEIFYRVEPKRDPLVRIREFVAARSGRSGIVYRATRKEVEKTALWLRERGVDALPYHAGLPDEVRRDNQEAFRSDEAPVMVATVAFGMGIDKPDIRFVVHGDLPRSLEAYYQETGRAGRDGDDAEVLLLWGAADIAKTRYHFREITDSRDRDRAERGLRSMIRYADTFGCRRRALLAHFDEEHPGACGGCDVCAGEIETVDATEAAQKLLSAVARTGERYGAHHVVDVLRGTATDKVRRAGHDGLPTYGVGADEGRSYWLSLTADLEARGCLRRDEERFKALAITDVGRELLFGRESFRTVRRAAAGRRETTHVRSLGIRGPARGDDDAVLNADEIALFEVLRKLRKRIADEKGRPPYFVFPDRTLRWMARVRPTDEQGLLAAPGVGEKKLGLYGDAFLAAIESGFTKT